MFAFDSSSLHPGPTFGPGVHERYLKAVAEIGKQPKQFVENSGLFRRIAAGNLPFTVAPPRRNQTGWYSIVESCQAQPLNHNGGSRGPRLLDGLLADDDNHWQVISGNAQDGYTVTYKGWRILGFTWCIAKTIKHPVLRGTYLTAGDSAAAPALTYSSLCELIAADVRVRGPLTREHQFLPVLPSRHDDSDPGVAKHIMDTLLGQTWEVNGDEIILTEWTIQRMTPRAICEDIYLKV